MNCNDVKDILYEYITQNLQGDDLLKVQKHLEDCENCRREAQKITRTLKLLNKVKPPPLSADFKETVLRRTQELPLPPKPFWQRIKEQMMPYLTPAPTPTFLKGLTIAVILLVAATIFFPQIFHKQETYPRDIEIRLHGVERPIIVEIDDSEKALEQLKERIRAHDGSVLQTIWVEDGIQVLFSVKQEQESSLVNDLSSLGNMFMEEKGHKDAQGNIGVVLKEKTKKFF
jgi:hypothetical protein